MVDVVDESAVVAERDLALDLVDVGAVLGGVGRVLALVLQHQLEALVEERHLAEPGLERLVGVVGGLEDRVAGVERGGGAGVLGLLVTLQRGVRHAIGEALGPAVAVAPDVDVEARAERIDHRHTDSVQPAGHLVAAAAELAAGVERREHERDRRDLLDRVLVDGDAAAVVDDPHAAVGLQRHFDVGGVAGEGFVDRVVDDLVDEVVEPALTRGADVHARPLAHGLQTLEKLDVAGIVRGIRGNGRLIGGLGHHSSIRAIVCVSATACLCRTT